MTKPVTPATWGIYVWIGTHYFTVFYPDNPSYEHRKAAIQYFQALPWLLPCKVCADEFRAILKSDPVEPHVENRTKLALWFFEVHNRVNRRLGKRELSMKEFIDMYSNPDSPLLPIRQDFKAVRVHGGDSSGGGALEDGLSERISRQSNSCPFGWSRSGWPAWLWFLLGVLATFAWSRWANRHVAK